MEKKYKVADFAAILGIVPKTVYKMIEREEIMTVSEKVNNRQTTLVVVTDEQLQQLKITYSKEQVNNGNCYGNVTVSNQSEGDTIVYEPVKSNPNVAFTNEVIDRIIALNDGYNEQIQTYNDRLQRVNEELITAKSKMLLLEDKAGREGLYFKEINELKTDNEKLKKFIHWLLGVIVLLLLLLTGYFTYNIAVNNRTLNDNIQEVTAQPESGIKKEAAEPVKVQQAPVKNVHKRK